MNMLLTKEQFLNQELKREEFDCKPYGLDGYLLLQEMTMEQRTEVSEYIQDNNAFKDFVCKVIEESVINEDGSKMFSDQEVHAIKNRSGKLIIDLYNKATVLSGITRGTIDDLEKKLEPTPKSGSGSD